MVKNLPAVGDMGSVPDLGRPRMPQNNCARVPRLLNLCSGACVPQSPRSATREATAGRTLTPQLEESLHGQETQHRVNE